MSTLTYWLMEGPAWVQYRTRLDLFGQNEDDKDVKAARQAMLKDHAVKALLTELSNWPGAVLNSHKSAAHPIHKLAFIADLGLHADDPGMTSIIRKVLAHQDDYGPFQVLMNIPKHFGGTGQDKWAWALCDAPLVIYALCRFGLADDRRVRAGIDYLARLVRPNGWPCAVSPELGRFRGPGRKGDPCPYANLVMLKLASVVPGLQASAKIGAKAALGLWARSRTEHPYMFYMGNDFRKLKAPLIWYDILHMLDVLTPFRWLRDDRRLGKMAEVVGAKADADGRFTPESVWQAWKDWEFAQKKVPSRWLTLVAMRSLARLSRSSRV